MSLWTPGGEHRVPSDEPEGPDGASPPGGVDPADLSPDERDRLEAAAAEMAEVRRRVSAVPAADVVANHLMGLYELAAIHLSNDPPDLDQAAVAIDAMSAVLDALSGRLGDAESTLADARSQMQMAFVQLKAARARGDEGEPQPGP